MSESAAGDVVLQAGLARATIRPLAGARVCDLTLQHPCGHAVSILYAYRAVGVDPVHWAKGGIYPLVPYSNRIARGRLHHPGGCAHLPPHPNAHPHTLHGHGHVVPWELVAQDAAAAHLRLDSPPCAAWPWHFQADLHLALSASSLKLSLQATHHGAGDMPAGVGFHPYFLHHPGARMRYAGTRQWAVDAGLLAIACGPVPVADSFASPRALPDGPRTDYLSGWDGALDLELPQGEVLHLQANAALSHLVLHRPGDPLYLCVEPVSHVADGFNLAARAVPDTGTVYLPPSGQLCGELTLSLGDTGF